MTEQSRVEAIFFGALEKKTPEERAAFLDTACGDDSELRQRVERLLAAHPQIGSFLEPPAPADADGAADDTRTVPPNDQSPAKARPDETGASNGLHEGVGSLIAGRYELLEVLGQGGMGVVFMARQTQPVKRVVALKLIKLGMDSKQVLARFETERQALALMNHPNIAKVLDAGTADTGRPFFVMELVKGVPITRFCDERQLSPRQRLELFIPVCQAIQHAHQKGIIHRDITPTNVLVALYDDRPVPMVIDFGIAKAVGLQLTDASAVTRFGAIVGTPEYMSPEQAQLNQLDVDSRSDVYALGVLLYELLTGTTPIDRKCLGHLAIFEVLRIIREEEPPLPSTRLSTSDALASIAATRAMEPSQLTKLIRGELDWILMKCLEKDRSRRYETANGLARDLQRYLMDEPVDASPPSAGYRLRKVARRYRALLATAAAFAALLVTGVVVSTWFALAADRNARLATAESKRTEVARQEAELRQKEAEAARAVAAKNAQQAAAAEFVAKERLAANYLDQGLRLTEEGEAERGALWFSRALETLPARNPGAVRLDADGAHRADDLERVIRVNLGAWRQSINPPRGRFPHQQDYGIVAAAYSQDGRRVMTASQDGTARVWDTAGGNPIGRPIEHPDQILCAAFSPDGKLVLTSASRDVSRRQPRTKDGPLPSLQLEHTVRLWDVEAGKPIGPALPHSMSVDAIAFSPDGKTAVTGSGDGAAQLWDLATGKPIGRPLLHLGAVIAVAFSPDGNTVATGSTDETARIWNSKTGKSISGRLHHRAMVVAVLFSPDGKKLLTATSVAHRHFPPIAADGETRKTTNKERMAQQWDWATAETVGQPLQHESGVLAIAYSPDGKTILTGSDDKTARLWDAKTGKPIGAPLQHEGAVVAVAYSPDGQTVLTGSGDKTARLWDTATGKAIGHPLKHRNTVRVVAYSPAGQSILTGSDDGTACLWDVPLSEPDNTPLHHDAPVIAVAYSPDGSTIVTGTAVKTERSQDAAGQLWNGQTRKPIGTSLAHKGDVHRVAFSPSDKTVLTASSDGTARLWESATGKPIGMPIRHFMQVMAAAFSPDGNRVVTGGLDGIARLSDAKSGKQIGPSLRHDVYVYAVAQSPDGKTVVTGCQDSMGHLWDAIAGKPIGVPLQHHKDVVFAVAFSPNGKTVATASDDKTARLWDAATGNPITPPLRHQDAVVSIVYSPDGRTVLTASWDFTARLWEVATGKPICPALQHQNHVNAVAYSPDSRMVVTASSDKTARLWDAATGKPIGAPLRHKGSVTSVAVSPDGKEVVTGSRDMTARIWPVHLIVPEGTPERISLWTQVLTGKRLDEGGSIGELEPQTWLDCRRRLETLGGPPIP
jgi:eukaryotic-like serine/threonine-protein kinase